VSGHTSRAKKRFGQHFLERPWVDKVAAAIEPRPEDVFLEIGPGRGALTQALTARARHVIAIEIDRGLAADLRRAAPSNLTVVESDFLALEPRQILRTIADAGVTFARLRVAGNLPYNVGSPILFALADLSRAGELVSDATVMLQQEVVDRLTAAPGTKEYGVLTVLLSYRAACERVLALPPGAFRPMPAVHSAVARLTFHAPDPAPIDEPRFQELVQAIFTRRRKTMANALNAFQAHHDVAPVDALNAASIDPMRRPETLSVAELARLSDVYARRGL
jgi:16S rRNA (adenine1518-N6/adenine1519-N6)-dimethyltransferase